MNFEIQTTDYFDVAAKQLRKRYRSFVDDYATFIEGLKKSPYQGVEIMPGIRKVRLTLESKGKGSAGGARVITFTYTISEKEGVIYLLLIYDKSDASNIKKNVVKAIVKDLGFDINKMEIEGKLKPINIKESDKQ